jgi:hypothetical protein
MAKIEKLTKIDIFYIALKKCLVFIKKNEQNYFTELILFGMYFV